LSWFADTFLLIALFLLASGALSLFLLWRKQAAEHALDSDTPKANFLRLPSWRRAPSAPTKEEEPWIGGVMEDEFWVGEDSHAAAPSAPRTGDNNDKEVPPAPRELIVALYVCAVRGGYFSGADVFAALERLGLRYGEMRIFHHDGLTDQATPLARGKPVFSVANLTEPGTFDPAQSDDFKTNGLVFFMRLPGPLDGRVALEFMLNHAYRLADLLKGNLEDEHRQTLNAESIAYLRQGIEEFERAHS
jgi:cell division protein ZipA